ncbi:YbaB/EbfC family nucleoid-associated protein [Solihabitans fulvus]|uniref:YbaB/EbfC family nucleoid-associated protein n=1 Tax=Solihabitans fulvus TaxID=1892852 RepID=A0A5B2X481_9PSEU|nr:YbaB/EbfC family nucleoid-associated protein [Solihabitans fulvus]KAA2258118.1 YbaB/EbfC family nucleoid-associated protein [Solihabitans fulvus]
MGARVESQQWLDGFGSKVSELQRRSAELQERLAESTATSVSPDETVTVTVSPTGSLLNLVLGRHAYTHTPAQLTTIIMKTVGQAQRQAASQVVEAFAPLGSGTQAMEMLTRYAPPDEDEVGEPEEADPYAPVDAPPPPAAPPMHAPSRPAARQAPARPAAQGDDEDENRLPW